LDANDWYRSSWQLMLTGSTSAWLTSPSPQCHCRIQKSCMQTRRLLQVHMRYWNVISIEVRRQTMAFDQLDQVNNVENKQYRL